MGNSMGNGASCVASAIVFACLSLLLGCSQAGTQVRPQKPAAPSLQYLGTWGSKGDEPGHLDDPTCIATDSVGNVYIADAGSLFIHKFDPKGTPLLAFQDGPLKHPQSITVDRGGAIYVTDPARGSVFVYLPNGDRYRELRLRSRPGSEDILSVAVGQDGLIHVLDANAGKVFTYTPRFRLIQTWQPPTGVTDAKRRQGAIAAGSDGYLYLADPAGNRIMRFTREGRLISEIAAGAGGTGGKLSDEFAVSGNTIFAMDADGRMLHVWSTDGMPKLDVDLAPELGQDGRFPPALAVSPHGELLVLDAPEARVLRYRTNF